MNPEPTIPDPFAPLGAWLRALREAAGRTQLETATAAGCSDRTWAKTEAGGRAPDTDELARALDFLGATPEQRLEVARLADILRHPEEVAEEAAEVGQEVAP